MSEATNSKISTSRQTTAETGLTFNRRQTTHERLYLVMFVWQFAPVSFSLNRWPWCYFACYIKTFT